MITPIRAARAAADDLRRIADMLEESAAVRVNLRIDEDDAMTGVAALIDAVLPRVVLAMNDRVSCVQCGWPTQACFERGRCGRSLHREPSLTWAIVEQ